MRDRLDEALALESGMTRRSLLQRGGTGAALVVGGGWLAACGGSDSDSSSAQGGKPVKGGTLRLGGSGGGENDTLDGQNALTNTDFARAYALFDPLVQIDTEGKLSYKLAESIEPNKDATEWTIRLRPNIVTHSGKPFEAADVLYSLRRIQKLKYPGSISFGPIDLNGAKVQDPQTLLVPFKSPYAIFPEGLVLVQSVMVPRDFDPKKPNGTGPFKFVSFTPGRESEMDAHTDYWDKGKPYLEKLIITNFNEETSQVNALQSGQVEAIDYLSATSVAAVEGAGGTAIISKTGAWGPFTMRVDREPFSDVKVRQALRLIPERPQMLEQVFGGYGNIANDLFGIFDPAFENPPQREQDLEQARSLLQSAGQSDLRLELITTANAPGQVQAAEVFATQAKEAGVTVNITNQQPTPYFADSYLKVPFSQDYWPYQPYLVAAQQATVKGAPFSATHQADPAYDKLYQQAIATVDEAQRGDIIKEMLDYDFENGGNIIPYNFPVIDAVAANVKGVKEGVSGVALNNFDWANIYMET